MSAVVDPGHTGGSGLSQSRPTRSGTGRTGPLVVGSGRRRGGHLPSWWLSVIDAVMIVGLGVLCAWPLGAAYTGRQWLVAVVAGLALGTGLAWAGARWRWGPWFSLLGLAAVYLLVGSAVAVPDKARNGLLPTPDSLNDLVVGLVETWRQALTLPVPLGESGIVMIVPFVTGLVGGFASGVFLWRTRWTGVAALVLGLVLLTSCAFGDIEAGAAAARGLTVAVLGIVWLRWRSLTGISGRWGRRAVATVVVVAAAGVPAAGLGFLGDAGQPRVVLRDHVDTPFDPRDYPSPLAKFRYYKKEPTKTGTVLFQVSGLESNALVRLAVMDTYDGIVWNVSGGPGSLHDSGTFRRLRNEPDANRRATTRGRITVADYTGVWVPSIGRTLAITPERDGRPSGEDAAELVINEQTGTVAQIGGVRRGTTYEVDADVPRELDDAEIETLEADTSVTLPSPRIVPEELMDRISTWERQAGTTPRTDGEMAQFLRDSFREKGFYSDGIDDYTPAGHGASRLAVLTKTPAPVGNAEQYAAAMALAGQRLGLPVRVVIGFRVPPGEDGSVRGENVTAWTEVKFKGAGWVAFDPTPPENQKLRQPNDDPNEEPQPQVLQPPRVPGEPKEATDNLEQGQGRKQRLDVLEVLGAVVSVAWQVTKVAALTSPLWGVLLFKWRRRRRRRRERDPALRLAAAWRELADRTHDLGVRPVPGATRRESAYAVAERYADTDVVALAHSADRHVYSDTRPTDEEAQAYWDDVDTALKRLRRSSPWWRRVLARFSLASVPWRAGVERARARVGARLRRIGSWLASRPPIPRLRAALRRRREKGPRSFKRER